MKRAARMKICKDIEGYEGVYPVSNYGRLLSQGQTMPVYDDVREDAVFPYITIGAFTCKWNGDKATDIGDASIQIHI
jgi:hypothetical protein